MFDSKLESILFIAARPMTVKKLADICDMTTIEVGDAIERIAERHSC